MIASRLVQALVGAVALAGALALALGPARAAAQPPTPIPSPGTGQSPAFVGAPATPHGFYAPDPPPNPFMAVNGRSEIHNDAYQSDANQISGPLGVSMSVRSTLLGGDCASVTFDREGRILTVCVTSSGPTLYMLDPGTLATLASMPLPARGLTDRTLNPFQDFTGGGYFYLDNQDRVVVATTTRHVYVIAEAPSASGPGFTLQHDYDLTSRLASGDRITSALPDWSGRIWVESFQGRLVTIDPTSGALHELDLGEEAENSFAVDETGAVFVVTVKALYRLEAAPDGTPQVIWREVYPNSGVRQPGQVDAGSGTTPTVQGQYVTITDNANPFDIVVYKRAAQISGSRLVCVQPTFAAGASSDENSLIGAGDTIVAENNYGYSGPTATEGGGRTAPGIERVDINTDGRGCHFVWQNTSERVPTAVSKLSLASGLIYTYTKDDPSTADPWYFTALDIRTGRVVYKQLAGAGLGFNNNYAPVTVGPDGSAYVGVLGGLVQLRDATPPSVPLALAPHRTPRLKLRLRRLRGARVRVSLTGQTGGVLRVGFRAGAYRRTLHHRPFRVTIALKARRRRLQVTIVLTDGDRTVLAHELPARRRRARSRRRQSQGVASRSWPPSPI